jgi:ankyrin repeat protein
VRAGVDIQVQTPQNLTVFDYCPIQNHEIFRLLVSAKPDLSKLENAKVAEIFIRLAKTGDVEAAKSFIHENGKAYVNGRDRLGYTPLIAAAQEGHVPMVKFLLEEGADIYAKLINNNKQSAIQIAFNYQKHNVVQILSEHEASLNRKGHAAVDE